MTSSQRMPLSSLMVDGSNNNATLPGPIARTNQVKLEGGCGGSGDDGGKELLPSFDCAGTGSNIDQRVSACERLKHEVQGFRRSNCITNDTKLDDTATQQQQQQQQQERKQEQKYTKSTWPSSTSRKSSSSSNSSSSSSFSSTSFYCSSSSSSSSSPLSATESNHTKSTVPITLSLKNIRQSTITTRHEQQYRRIEEQENQLPISVLSSSQQLHLGTNRRLISAQSLSRSINSVPLVTSTGPNLSQTYNHHHHHSDQNQLRGFQTQKQQHQTSSPATTNSRLRQGALYVRRHYQINSGSRRATNNSPSSSFSSSSCSSVLPNSTVAIRRNVRSLRQTHTPSLLNLSEASNITIPIQQNSDNIVNNSTSCHKNRLTSVGKLGESSRSLANQIIEQRRKQQLYAKTSANTTNTNSIKKVTRQFSLASSTSSLSLVTATVKRVKPSPKPVVVSTTIRDTENKTTPRVIANKAATTVAASSLSGNSTTTEETRGINHRGANRLSSSSVVAAASASAIKHKPISTKAKTSSSTTTTTQAPSKSSNINRLHLTSNASTYTASLAQPHRPRISSSNNSSGGVIRQNRTNTISAPKVANNLERAAAITATRVNNGKATKTCDNHHSASSILNDKVSVNIATAVDAAAATAQINGKLQQKKLGNILLAADNKTNDAANIYPILPIKITLTTKNEKNKSPLLANDIETQIIPAPATTVTENRSTISPLSLNQANNKQAAGCKQLCHEPIVTSQNYPLDPVKNFLGVPNTPDNQNNICFNYHKNHHHQTNYLNNQQINNLDEQPIMISDNISNDQILANVTLTSNNNCTSSSASFENNMSQVESSNGKVQQFTIYSSNELPNDHMTNSNATTKSPLGQQNRLNNIVEVGKFEIGPIKEQTSAGKNRRHSTIGSCQQQLFTNSIDHSENLPPETEYSDCNKETLNTGNECDNEVRLCCKVSIDENSSHICHKNPHKIIKDIDRQGEVDEINVSIVRDMVELVVEARDNATSLAGCDSRSESGSMDSRKTMDFQEEEAIHDVKNTSRYSSSSMSIHRSNSLGSSLGSTDDQMVLGSPLITPPPSELDVDVEEDNEVAICEQSINKNKVAITQQQAVKNEVAIASEIPIKSEPICDYYDLETRPFARGKFAQVKRCINKSTKQCFAAKCIKKRRRLVDIRHEILLEIEALKLSQYTKHIVKLYEVYETSSEMILVLEMANGGELQRVLDDEESIEERLVKRMVSQILEGLIHLHENDIAHLDIKPQNLLLTETYPNGDVKLCDFGISRRITKDCEIREICGTPDYVAPEILRYDPIGLATDMWSLGVLTYVLLSGYSPFGSENKQQTFCNITQAALDFPSEIFDKISKDAIDFMQKLIVREPSERLTSQQARNHPWLSQ